MITDKERLDFLQKLTERRNYTGLVILRESVTGRGWRLHETNSIDAVSSVREAIDKFMAEYKWPKNTSAVQNYDEEYY